MIRISKANGNHDSVVYQVSIQTIIKLKTLVCTGDLINPLLIGFFGKDLGNPIFPRRFRVSVVTG